MKEIEIIPYTPDREEDLIKLTLRAWRPVFARTATEVPRYVYDAFYPNGWEERQTRDVRALLEDDETNCWLACQHDTILGYVGLRLHPEDQMGEVHILAVDPEHQGEGVGTTMMGFAERQIRAAGMQMIMVETVGDTGHAAARRLYEASGYDTWPVARYFKRL